MKRFCLLGIAVMVLLLLAACSCRHEWKDADCIHPKTCSLCGVTVGQPLGHAFDDSAPDCEHPKLCGNCSVPEADAKPHTWLEADCARPKTCDACGKIEGEPLSHVWQEASCTQPKNCTLCGAQEGAPIGHSWMAATCAAPKICENCGQTEGEAKDHAWQEATCVTPKLCQSCYATEGEALGHDWQEATTYEPKTCRVCGMTDGEKIDVDPRFRTNACKFLFGKWISMVTESLEIDGTVYSIEYQIHFEFYADGTCLLIFDLGDPEQFEKDYSGLLEAMLYYEVSLQGMTKDQADAQFKAITGMTISQYCQEAAAVYVEAMTEPMKLVYYVQGKKIFFAETWKSTFSDVEYYEMGSKLQLSSGYLLSPAD